MKSVKQVNHPTENENGNFRKRFWDLWMRNLFKFNIFICARQKLKEVAFCVTLPHTPI